MRSISQGKSGGTLTQRKSPSPQSLPASTATAKRYFPGLTGSVFHFIGQGKDKRISPPLGTQSQNLSRKQKCVPADFGTHFQKAGSATLQNSYGLVPEVGGGPLSTIPVMIPAAAAPAPTPIQTQGMWVPARTNPPAPAPAPAPATSAPVIAVWFSKSAISAGSSTGSVGAAPGTITVHSFRCSFTDFVMLGSELCTSVVPSTPQTLVVSPST